MGITNASKFTDRQNELATLFKALGHPARVSILEYLLEQDRCICNDLVDELPLSQATVSQHLRALKDAGLIIGNIEGTSVCYCINSDKWNRCKNICGHLFGRFTFACCQK